MAPDTASVPAQSQELTGLNKKVSELISADTKIRESGAVTGTLNYINKWEEFNPSDPQEQSGYYMPVKLGDDYKEKNITVTGTKTVSAKDTEWVLFVKNTDSEFKFSTDTDGNFLTLTFKNAVLKPKPIMMANTRAVKRKKTTTDP